MYDNCLFLLRVIIVFYYYFEINNNICEKEFGGELICAIVLIALNYCVDGQHCFKFIAA